MITYGHEQVIARAIKGVLMQRGDFDLELIIADDCSPDQTEAVVKACLAECESSGLKRANDQVIYHRHKHNKGMAANFLWTWEACRGDYIAICEGDDEWIDPDKIRLQLLSLANSKAVISFHEVNEISMGIERRHSDIYGLNKVNINFLTALKLWPATVSFFWKNVKLSDSIRDLMLKTWSCDQMMLLFILMVGDGIFIDRVMANHYKLPTGATNSLNRKKWIMKRIESLEILMPTVNAVQKKQVLKAIYSLRLVYLKRFSGFSESIKISFVIVETLIKLRMIPSKRDLRFLIKREYNGIIR